MNQSAFQDPAWLHAVTLTERLESLRATRSESDRIEVDAELANRRLQRWRSQSPFTSDDPFNKRLNVGGLTEQEFLRLLGEPIEALSKRIGDVPPWLREIAEAYSRAEGEDASAGPQKGKRLYGLLTLIEPLIRQSHRRLEEGLRRMVESSTDLPFDPATVKSILFAGLPGLFTSLIGRTIALEVNVARLQGLLKGETPEERFTFFIEGLRRPETALALLREYPVLARQFVVHINNWLNFHLEFLEHLCADWAEIRESFAPGSEPGVLSQLEGGVGDSHRGGRSVLIATFTKGFQVVYKPKSLAVDMHLQELLEWLNERGEHPSFRTVRVIERGSYGWTEFVEARSCTTEDELKRFYERQGGYLALLYALEATDFHYENLIASGEHPVLIDLESLFHPRAEGVDTPAGGGAINDSMGYSVLRVGILPQRVWFNADEEGIDLSGLGGQAGQLTPKAVPMWEKPGTDEMRLERRRIEMAGAKNRPAINGADVNPLQYREELVKGFTSVFRLLIKHRDELLAEDGLLARFASDEVRFIMRPTRVYSLLLHESFHPDMLRNGLDRDRFFDRLWVGITERPYLARVIPAEVQDLQNGDIPMFTTRPDSRDIWTSRGERIADFLDETGLRLVERRMKQLGEEDLNKQLWFINASLTTLAMGSDGAHWASYRMIEPELPATREQLLQAACAVADRLEELALRDEHEVSWIGVALLNEKNWTLLPLGVDLYNGLGGVAFFLAQVGAVTGIERYTKLARVAVNTIRRHVEVLKSQNRNVGGFDGWGGWIYLLTHLGQLWNEPELLAEAESHVEQLHEMIEVDEFLDIISGTAGCLGGLLALYSCAPSEKTMAAAVKCGDHLIESAKQMEHGIGWLTPMTGSKPLAGFSHGASGITSMLLALGSLTGEERFKRAALEGFAYERSIFSDEIKNWPDLREMDGVVPENDDGEGHFMLAWCHGAPGVGLGRLRSLPYLDDDEIRDEIDVAVRSTLRDGFGHNHSLCHGDLGNIELIMQAGDALCDEELGNHVNRLASIILESIRREGWLCGIPLGVESPGLMTGLAGIGYGLLRLAEPERVPCILTMEPPAGK
ncbi:MAG TPA: type 2 lanthipeptide synthetase LanM family protein [Pyrinomonadaceae bacterium]|nr:type 2 lanthipeptide synthetase LanM family protein [Pyrinomonadaceae bacterium]